MRLDINLASQAYEDARRFWQRWGTGVALLAIFTLLLVFYAVSGWVLARQDRRQLNGYREQIAARDREKAHAETFLNRPENRVTRDKSQFLNELIQRKSFSWTRVFAELEQVMPARLHVVSIHPEMTADNELEIKLVVAGESRERALELVRRMEGSPRFTQTQITQDMQSGGQTPGDNVQVDIEALYVPEKPLRSVP